MPSPVVKVPLIDNVILILAHALSFLFVINNLSFKLTLFESTLNNHIEDGLRRKLLMN